MKKNSLVIFILMCTFSKGNSSLPPSVTTLATLSGVASLSASTYCIIQASEQRELLRLAEASTAEIRELVRVWNNRIVYTGAPGCVLLLAGVQNARCKSAAAHWLMAGSIMYGMGTDFAVKAKMNHRLFILIGAQQCKEKRNKCMGAAALMAVLGTFCVAQGMAC